MLYNDMTTVVVTLPERLPNHRDPRACDRARVFCTATILRRIRALPCH